MNHWLFFTFHIISLGFCLFTTRITLRYLAKHQMIPKERYLPFGFLRIRHIALFYCLGIAIVTIFSLFTGIYYLF